VKKPLDTLARFDARLTRVEKLIATYRGNLKKNQQAELLNQLKPELMEKVKSGSGESVQILEDLVKAAELDVEPFYRGCKAPVSECSDIADKAANSVELAKNAAADARVEACPIDESLDEEVKKELQLFVKAEIKKSSLRIGILERRMHRCSQLVKSFRADIMKKQGQRIGEVKVKVIAMIRKLKADEVLNTQQLFARFSPAEGLVDEDGFQQFFKDAGVGDDIPSEDIAATFASFLREGSSQMNEKDFKKIASTYMKVVKATSLTNGLSVSSSKALKQLKVGQVLEVLEGPEKDDSIKRVRVKMTSAGGVEGWATVMGNAGGVFLKDCDAPAPQKKKVA